MFRRFLGGVTNRYRVETNGAVLAGGIGAGTGRSRGTVSSRHGSQSLMCSHTGPVSTALAARRVRKDVLESVGFRLPPSVQLNPHLDAAENHFFAALEVYSKLNDVAIINGKRLAVLRGRAETDMVEERAGRALDVANKPLAVLAPELAVAAADDLALKAHRRG